MNQPFNLIFPNLVPSLSQKGTQFQIFKFSSDEGFFEKKIKKVPSWDQKGTQLALSRHQVETKSGLVGDI